MILAAQRRFLGPTPRGAEKDQRGSPEIYVVRISLNLWAEFLENLVSFQLRTAYPTHPVPVVVKGMQKTTTTQFSSEITVCWGLPSSETHVSNVLFFLVHASFSLALSLSLSDAHHTHLPPHVRHSKEERRRGKRGELWKTPHRPRPTVRSVQRTKRRGRYCVENDLLRCT